MYAYFTIHYLKTIQYHSLKMIELSPTLYLPKRNLIYLNLCDFRNCLAQLFCTTLMSNLNRKPKMPRASHQSSWYIIHPCSCNSKLSCLLVTEPEDFPSLNCLVLKNCILHMKICAGLICNTPSCIVQMNKKNPSSF